MNILPGLYSDGDVNVLYEKVKENKPTTILDLGPRQGRTTSTIVESICHNYPTTPVKYYLFEKDERFFYGIKKYLQDNYSKPKTQIDFCFNKNIMEANPQTHPDIIDPYVHKQLYPTIYEKYHIHGEVKIDEEDVVREHLSHNENYEFSSTTKQWSFPDCALWIKVVKKNNDDNSDLSESK